MPELIQTARTMDLEPVRAFLERQLQCNTAIVAEGLKGQWGAGIGEVLLQRVSEDIRYKNPSMGSGRIGCSHERM